MYSPPTEQATAAQATSARTVSVRTRTIRNNGFNPVWNEDLCIPFDCVGGAEMRGLIFLEVKICQDGGKTKEAGGGEPIGLYCTPMGCMEQGECLDVSHGDSDKLIRVGERCMWWIYRVETSAAA